VANGAPGNKEGFGTSTTVAGKAWFTLAGGELSEVYAPDLGTPSLRDLQFVVSDGRTFAERETDDATHRTELADPRSLTYRQVDATSRWRITKTYVVDPARSTVLVDVTFESLTGKPYQLYALYDPSLQNGGDDDTATSQNGQLLASDSDGNVASALVGSPGFAQTSSGYKGTSSDGWTDLSSDYTMNWSYDSASSPGNVVQIGKTTLTGLSGSQHLTLALGFGTTISGALSEAQGSLSTGFDKLRTDYQTGWHDYLSSLNPVRPAPTPRLCCKPPTASRS
jgi:glucoamylase